MNSEERSDLNQRQREFYDKKEKNVPTRIWSYFRNGLLNRIKKNLGVEKDIYDLHRTWFGDLSGKKVLDLGCYKGNSLSMYLAENAETYLGIDLSEKGIDHLSQRVKKVQGAKAEVQDFLSDEFTDSNFDLIYAYGVLHHFKDVDYLILKLKEKLKTGGIVISHDPLQTSFPIKILRKIYRPFQSDKEWEWPFSRKTYYKFEEAFTILERRGVLGHSKWAFILDFLPMSDRSRMQKAKKWHRQDWNGSAENDGILFRCMHLSLIMRKEVDV